MYSYVFSFQMLGQSCLCTRTFYSQRKYAYLAAAVATKPGNKFGDFVLGGSPGPNPEV